MAQANPEHVKNSIWRKRWRRGVRTKRPLYQRLIELARERVRYKTLGKDAEKRLKRIAT